MKQVNGKPLMSGRKGKPARTDRGFTLIETVVSLVIMMIVGLGAASLFMYAVRNNSGAADRAVAIAIAQQRMERLRNVTFTDASLNAGTTNTTVTSAGRGYRVQTTICATVACGGSATLKRITVQVTPTSAGSVWASNSVTIISLRSTPTAGTFVN
ncbi:MAG TPA: prepilin-type N-terminal cleavage/methylation domain-containing protein [Pyrinomonadaceae bacterium]|nr:prepilin-type N-terminal cleavage/methylation domain-containing protein [Pyrinomonadaceae bacterium]